MKILFILGIYIRTMTNPIKHLVKIIYHAKVASETIKATA